MKVKVSERAACVMETRREVVIVDARAGGLNAHRVTALVDLGPGAMRRIVIAQQFVAARLNRILAMAELEKKAGK